MAKKRGRKSESQTPGDKKLNQDVATADPEAEIISEQQEVALATSDVASKPSSEVSAHEEPVVEPDQLVKAGLTEEQSTEGQRTQQIEEAQPVKQVETEKEEPKEEQEFKEILKEPLKNGKSDKKKNNDKKEKKKEGKKEESRAALEEVNEPCTTQNDVLTEEQSTEGLKTQQIEEAQTVKQVETEKEEPKEEKELKEVLKQPLKNGKSDKKKNNHKKEKKNEGKKEESPAALEEVNEPCTTQNDVTAEVRPADSKPAEERVEEIATADVKEDQVEAPKPEQDGLRMELTAVPLFVANEILKDQVVIPVQDEDDDAFVEVRRKDKKKKNNQKQEGKKNHEMLRKEQEKNNVYARPNEVGIEPKTEATSEQQEQEQREQELARISEGEQKAEALPVSNQVDPANQKPVNEALASKDEKALKSIEPTKAEVPLQTTKDETDEDPRPEQKKDEKQQKVHNKGKQQKATSPKKTVDKNKKAEEAKETVNEEENAVTDTTKPDSGVKQEEAIKIVSNNTAEVEKEGSGKSGKASKKTEQKGHKKETEPQEEAKATQEEPTNSKKGKKQKPEAKREENSITPSAPVVQNAPKPKTVSISEDDDGVFEVRPVFLPNTCHLCKVVHSDTVTLKSCAACRMIAYCSTEHQKEHWPEHRAVCKFVRRELEKNKRKHIFENAKNCDYGTWKRTRYTNMIQCEDFIKRSLQPYEREMFLYPRHCETCYETDGELLHQCKKCWSSFSCSAEHKKKDHDRWCGELKLLFDLTVEQAKSGRIEPPFPDKVFQQYEILPGSIKEFLVTRMLGPGGILAFGNVTFACLTEAASYPLTLLHALQRLEESKSDLEKAAAADRGKALFTFKPVSELKSMVIHVVGAELAFECDSIIKWDIFFVHLLPKLKSLRVVFIGPELTSGSGSIPNGVCDEDLRCPHCITSDRKIEYDFQPGLLYQDYVKSPQYVKPDAIAAYNCGLYRETGFAGTDTWGPSISAMTADSSVPLILTAYTSAEAPKDTARVLRSVPSDVLIVPQKNPYRSLKPCRNFVDEDTMPVMYKNNYFSVMHGV